MLRKLEDDEEKPLVPPEQSDFDGQQLDLFRSFLCNNETERSRLSNAFDLWDSVPRYSVSRKEMDTIRKEKGFLDLLDIDFQYRGTALHATIQPARIREKPDAPTKDYYPSANEELIEDALRKIAADQRNGYHNTSEKRSGVVFSLYMLKEELKKRGHTRSYQQIVLSLNILASSIIEIRSLDGKRGEGVTKSAYFSGLAASSKYKLADDPESKWIVQFHPLVTRAIDTLTYRQFNYAQMMSHKTQIARWLHKQLSLKFTFASIVNPFEMRYSTIKRDSAMFDNYTRERKGLEDLNRAFDELVTGGILCNYTKVQVLGLRGKVQDVIYTLHAHPDFCREIKAANKRENLALEKIETKSLTPKKKR